MTTASAEVIATSDRASALTTLTLAFSSDPIMRWAWPEALIYATYWPRIADAFGGRAFDHGTARGIGSQAVALWLAPGITPDEETVMRVMEESMDAGTLEEIGAVFEQMGEHHPSDAHWYLPLTGVDPPSQGQGLGSALLRQGLATCDRDRLDAYLEATSPRNRDLYRRHGFEVKAVIQAGSSPPMWAMIRPPAYDG